MIYIHGLGHFHPENVIDNKFLEDLDIGTGQDWIMERVGIKTRRTVLPLDYIKSTKNIRREMAQEASLYTNAQTGALAATQAIKNAKIKKEDIGMVISGSCSPQYSCPAEASTIAAELGIEALSYDLGSACSTLVSQLHFIDQMGSDKLPPYVLLVIPENNTRTVDYSDRNSAVLWGDCSGAMIVSTQIPSPYTVTNTSLQSSPKGWDKVTIPASGHFRQEGKTVQTFAIKRSLSVIKNMRSKFSPNNIRNEKFVGHQANLMMLRSVCRIAKISDQSHFYNVDNYGNCGAAGSLSVLSQNWENFQKGDNIVLAVVGAGLTWGGALIEYCP